MNRPSLRLSLRVVVATLLAVSGALVAMPTPSAHAAVSSIVVSEFRTRGTLGGNDEFVEIYNASPSSVPIGGWKINASNNAGTTGTRVTITAGTTLGSGCHYLITNATASTGYSGSVAGDQTYLTGFTDDGGVAVLDASNVIFDQVGMSAGSAYKEGATLTPTTTNLNQGQERKPGGALGSTQDTNDNVTDFTYHSASIDPQNSLSPCIPPGGDAAPSVSTTTPANGATNVALASNITVNFSESVHVTSSWLNISGSSSGAHTYAYDSSPSGNTESTSWVADPTSDFVNGETVTVTVNAAQVGDTDATDPPDNMAGNYVFSFQTVPADVAPSVSSTTPTNGAGQQALNTDITVNFSESVHVTSSWLTISGSVSGAHTYTYDSSPTAQTEASTWVANPDSDFVNGETVTVTVVANQVGDTDVTDPPENMAANYVFSFGTPLRIHDVQGATHLSPYAGQTVTGIPGIVTALRSNGFYLQDPIPDANDNTSEGIFVFTSSVPAGISPGQSVTVSGTVSEFRAGGAASGSLTNTEITSPSVVLLSSGNPLPAPIVAGTGGRIPPNGSVENDASGSVETSGVFDPAQDGIDFWETLEYMRVQLNNAHVVGPTSDFGSNREVPVVGDNGANAAILTPRGGILLRETDTNGERIILNDVITGGPTLATTVDVGDSYPGATVGVIDYAFNNFKLEITSIPSLVSGGIAQEVTTNPGTDEVSIGSFNVENLDPGDGPGKFSDLANEIVTNMKSPDIIAVEELQDNNGATNDSTVDATTTLNTLVSAVQSAGGPTYSYRLINPVDDQDGGEPGGNIRVAFLFRTDRGVAFVDRPGGGSTTADSVVNNGGVPELAQSPGRLDPTNPAFNSSRKPLAGEFTYNGRTLFLIANHWNSKGGDDPLWGRFQPPVLNSEVQRVQQAQIVHDFVASILAIDANANVVVLGDLNDFSWSNPLDTVTTGGVLEDLVLTLPEAERYSYVFEGNTQELDHLLASPHMADQMTLYDPIHANAEFAPQVSDHDPLVALFSFPSAAPLTCTLTGTSGPNTIDGTPGPDHICGKGGDDIINGLGGNDIIEGGAGNDTLSGGDLDDLVDGGAGDDTMNGDNGNDELTGKKGVDNITGGAGSDDIKGGYGNDTLNSQDGVSGNDSIDGGKGVADACTADPGDSVQHCP